MGAPEAAPNGFFLTETGNAPARRLNVAPEVPALPRGRAESYPEPTHMLGAKVLLGLISDGSERRHSESSAAATPTEAALLLP